MQEVEISSHGSGVFVIGTFYSVSSDGQSLLEKMDQNEVSADSYVSHIQHPQMHSNNLITFNSETLEYLQCTSLL